MTDTVTIHEYIERDMSDSLTMVGFPSVGMVGSIAGSFLVNSMDLELTAALMSDNYPPIAVVRNKAPRPPVRIYSGKRVCEPGGLCSQIGVITSEMPISGPPVHITARAILDWCQKKGCSKIVTVEGINVAEAPEDDSVFAVASNSRMLDLVTKHGVKTLDNGMVGGLSGVLLYLGAMTNQNVLCLMGEVAVDKLPDARAAAHIVEVLGHLLPELKLDPKPLLEDARKLEEALKNEIQQATPTQPEGAQSPPSPFMYG